MYDGAKIVTGLVVFVVVVTFPFWYSVASGESRKTPELALPQGGGQCVLPSEEMRDAHMALLDDWRNLVVRNGLRYLKDDPGRKYLVTTGADGKPLEMSLTKTCLGCHQDKAAFCDRCHNYLAVKPFCWDCHVVPERN